MFNTYKQKCPLLSYANVNGDNGSGEPHLVCWSAASSVTLYGLFGGGLFTTMFDTNG